MIVEFPIARIILANTSGDVRVLTPADLLPYAFGAAALSIKEPKNEDTDC